MATQDEYRAKAREALEKLQQQIDELKVQANLAGAEARDRFDKAIDVLRKRQAETRAKVDQAADASGDAWKGAAKQMEEAVDGIARRGDRHQRAVGRLGGQGGAQGVPRRVEEATRGTREAHRLCVTKARDHERHNRQFWDADADDYQAVHGGDLTGRALAWGAWRSPEAELGVLGDVGGLDVLELGCGAGQWSIALAARAVRPVGLDQSLVQLKHAAANQTTALNAGSANLFLDLVGLRRKRVALPQLATICGSGQVGLRGGKLLPQSSEVSHQR